MTRALRFTREAVAAIDPYEPGRSATRTTCEATSAEGAKLSSNECPYGPFAAAREAMGAAAAEVHRYPDTAASLLRQKLAPRLGVPASRLIVGNGSSELIRLLAGSVLSPGDEAVMARPSFAHYKRAVQTWGATPVEIPLRDFRHDLRAIAEAVTDRTRVVFICNPNNPTGTVVGSRDLEGFVRSLPKDVVVVVDEAYHEYVEAKEYASAIELAHEHPNVVVLRTFSKIYGLAGARVGYGVADEEIVAAVDRLRDPFNVNVVGQIGAVASLAEEQELARRRSLSSEQKRLLCESFERLGLAFVPSQANFVYVDLGEHWKSVRDALDSAGVVVRTFDEGRFIRVTVGRTTENRRLVDTLARAHPAKSPGAGLR